MDPKPTAAPRPLNAFTLGTGSRPTVLLHGFLGSGANLRSLAQRWLERSPDRRFLLLDLTGHGTSPPLPQDATLASVARDVLASTQVFSALPLELVGHSLGGRVALAALDAAPEEIASVTLIDIAPGPVDPALSLSRGVLDVLLAAPERASNRRQMREHLIASGLSAALADWLLMNLVLEDGQMRWRIDRHAMDRLHEAFNRVDLWPVVQRTHVPVRCIRGGRSAYVNEADVARFARAGVRVDTLADAGHYPHVDALPELVELLATG